MQTFLGEVAEKILADQRPFDQLTIVLPSRRAVRFLQREIALRLKQATLAPKICSIEGFVGELAGLNPIEPLPLLLRFYKIYKKNTREIPPQPLDQFLNWAPLLLKDFNDLDTHLVDTQALFAHLASYHRIKTWAQEEESTPLIKNYLTFWEEIPRLYEALYTHLYQRQTAYLGMHFREAVDALEIYLENTQSYHYFVGFNALNKAESYLIQGVLDRDRGETLWDIDAYFYEGPHHPSGRFIREYFKHWKPLRHQKTPTLSRYYTEQKTINLVGCTKGIAQAKHAANLAAAAQMTDENQSVALVLGDEQLLIPTLSGLPPAFDDYNVTMGYPLSKTPLYAFFMELIALYQQSPVEGFPLGPFRSLVQLPVLATFLKATVPGWEDFFTLLTKQNQRLVLRDNILALEDPNLSLTSLFGLSDVSGSFISGLGTICTLFIEHLTLQKQPQDQWNLYYFERFKKLFLQLAVFQKEHVQIEKLSVLRQFLKELVALESIDFSGTPLRGLQIMGVLESRLLDFDTIIITGVNEGILPAGKGGTSFLPFEVKKKFEIPTFLEQDAIYTYHFYRLLQRAKTIHILYNTHSEGLNAGAPSRFVHQLELLPHPAHQTTSYTLSNPVINIDKKGTTLEKTSGVLTRLHEWASQGVSPSALSCYLRDPFDFYQQYVLGVRETMQWSGAMDPRQSGTFLHTVFEQLYAPYVGQRLVDKHFKAMLAQFDKMLLQHYADMHGGNTRRTGKNLLIYEALKYYGNNWLVEEQKRVAQGAQIKILSLEQKVMHSLRLPNLGHTIVLQGHIDRIDEYNGQLRIIDYKSGKITPSMLNITSWDKVLNQEKPGPAFQLLTYAYLYHFSVESQPLFAGIMAFQDPGSYTIPLLHPGSVKSSEESQLLSKKDLLEFEKQLILLVEELMNPKLPFSKDN